MFCKIMLPIALCIYQFGAKPLAPPSVIATTINYFWRAPLFCSDIIQTVLHTLTFFIRCLKVEISILSQNNTKA